MGVNLVYVIKLGGEVMLRVVPPPIRKLAETRDQRGLENSSKRFASFESSDIADLKRS